MDFLGGWGLGVWELSGFGVWGLGVVFGGLGGKGFRGFRAQSSGLGFRGLGVSAL